MCLPFFAAAVCPSPFPSLLPSDGVGDRSGLCDRYTGPQMVIGGTFISLVAGYALGCLPYVVMDWLRWQPVASYKLQPTRYVSRQVRAGSGCPLL